MYVGLVVCDAVFDFLGNLKVLAFSILLSIISLNLIAKGILIKSSSTLWFAITLILFAIDIMIYDIIHLSPHDFYFVYGIIPIISSLINLAIFSNLIYIKVIILNISILIPLILSYYLNLNIFWILGILAISLVIGIIVCRCISLKREKV